MNSGILDRPSFVLQNNAIVNVNITTRAKLPGNSINTRLQRICNIYTKKRSVISLGNVSPQKVVTLISKGRCNKGSMSPPPETPTLTGTKKASVLKPLKASQGRKPAGIVSALVLRHPSPREGPSLASSVNVSGSLSELAKRIGQPHSRKTSKFASEVSSPKASSSCKYTSYKYKKLALGVKKPLKLSPVAAIVPRKLNKVERARETLIQWIQEYSKKSVEPPQTTEDFYIIGRILGKGAFGKVNLCVHKLSERLVAVKSLHKKYLESGHNNAKLQNEIEILRLLRHKNVMRLYETFTAGSCLLIVLELCAGGDLLTYVRKRRRLTESVAKTVFKQILDGISHCHANGVVHRDIKLDNILLNFYGDVKIGDFGVSRRVTKGQKLHERCGTPAYIAPEILKETGYDGTQVDLWSAGIVLYAMLYGNFPFRGENAEELERLILAGKYELKAEVSESARDLIRKMLDPNGGTRITIDDIYSHPWMSDVDPKVCLFTDEEISAIKKEYDYKERNINSSASSDEGSSVFTVHGLDTSLGDNKNDCSKSTVLAPFNSNEPEGQSFLESVEPLIVSKRTIRFCAQLREVDRRYERDNNSKIDNGIYVSQIAATKCASIKGLKMGHTRTTASCSTVQSSSSQLDQNVLGRMAEIGFDRSFAIASLNANVQNSATTCYYLLAE